MPQKKAIGIKKHKKTKTKKEKTLVIATTIFMARGYAFISKHFDVGGCEEKFMESGYLRVADKSEIAMGKMKKVTIDGNEVLVANVNGNYFAVSSECTHYGGDLSEGVLDGNVVTCPNHGSKFDVTTGKVVSPPVEPLDRPEIKDLPKYLVKVENQDIMVKV